VLVCEENKKGKKERQRSERPECPELLVYERYGAGNGAGK
jgi:hypothetical protein